MTREVLRLYHLREMAVKDGKENAEMKKGVVGSILTVCIMASMTFPVFAGPEMPGYPEPAGTMDISDNENIQATEAPEQNPKGEESGTREGWVKEEEKNYYYKDGKRQTGWQEIENGYYYFDKRGVLQKNKIAGNKKNGYYYVDPDGIRVTDTAVEAAVKFVMKHSDAEDSSRKRLKSCYNALARYQYRRVGREKPASDKMKAYALEMFKNKRGDCYRFAAALAYIACVLGYDSRTSFDNSVTLHGWTEIKVKGKWQTCDCSMRRVDKKNNFFLADKAAYVSLVKAKWGAVIRWDSTYRMYVEKGKISWK